MHHLSLFSFVLLCIASFVYSQDSTRCGTKSVSTIPGCWGVPGCAYYLASAGSACKYDWCNCGGINVPLLPETTSGTTTVGCASYTIQPTVNHCPTGAASIPGQGSAARSPKSTLVDSSDTPSTTHSHAETLTKSKGGTTTSTRPARSLITGLTTFTSATATPAITPPPAGSPGSIPYTSLSGGKSEKHIAITLHGETYILPHTISVELLQSDGSFVTLFSNSIVSGAATLTVSSASIQTTLSSGSLSLQAGPEPSPSAGSGNGSGGGDGFSGLINALESLAGSANSIVNTLDQIGNKGALWAAGSLSSSGFSTAAGGLLDSVTSDLGNFVSTISSTMGDYETELDELTEDGIRRVFQARTGAVEEFDLLQSLKKLVRGITGLRNNAVLNVKDHWKQGTAAAAALAAAEEALRNFGSYHWDVEKRHTSTSSTTTMSEQSSASSTTVKAPEATESSYLIRTKDGTDLSTFYNFIKTLPDKGKGLQIVYPNNPWQSYVTNLTAEQADEVSRQPFIYWVLPNTENESPGFGAIPPAQILGKRLPHSVPPSDIWKRLDSDPHLKILSTANQKTLSELPDYFYDPILGHGQTIYILDGGFNTAHTEFGSSADSSRTVRTHVVPNDFTLLNPDYRANAAPEDITDYNGHGTGVASVAGGLNHGVASNANLVLVKFKQAFKSTYSGNWIYPGATDSALEEAWDFVIDDVQQQRRNGYPGKSIVVMSYGFVYDPPRGVVPNKVLQKSLNDCWARDIITVVAAGNGGADGDSLDQASPQRLGTADNGLITVGGVDNNGMLLGLTTFDAGKGGSMSVYAQGSDVIVADYKSPDGGTVTKDGTSYAAPAIAGLAAYFASLASLSHQWTQDHVATDMKNYIINAAYVRPDNPFQGLPANYPRPQPESIKVGYNQAPEGLCFLDKPFKRAAIGNSTQFDITRKEPSSGDVPIIVSGTIVPSASSLVQSYCSDESTKKRTTKTTTTKKTTTKTTTTKKTTTKTTTTKTTTTKKTTTKTTTTKTTTTKTTTTKKKTTKTTTTKTTVTKTTPSPTSKVVIAFDYTNGDANWYFFLGPIAQTSFDFCNPRTSHTITPLPDVATSPLPTGTFSIGVVGGQQKEDNCVYKNSGNNAGTLTCDGIEGFNCNEISPSKYPKEGDCSQEAAIEWRVQCQW